MSDVGEENCSWERKLINFLYSIVLYEVPTSSNYQTIINP